MSARDPETALDGFLAAVPWRMWPAYLGLAILTGWLGYLTTAPDAALASVRPTVAAWTPVLVLVFAATPLLFAAAGAIDADREAAE